MMNWVIKHLKRRLAQEQDIAAFHGSIAGAGRKYLVLVFGRRYGGEHAAHGLAHLKGHGAIAFRVQGDYDADTAKTKVIKEGSSVEVLVNHMDGMKGGTATIKSYSLPANISDITMKDGMKMNNHKWLTNDEVA